MATDIVFEIACEDCDKPVTPAQVDWLWFRLGRPRHSACVIRAREAEVKRLKAWTTRDACPPGCDGTYDVYGHVGGGSSDHNGACRHGVYVGGSGIDWTCGTCEGYSLEDELAALAED